MTAIVLMLFASSGSAGAAAFFGLSFCRSTVDSWASRLAISLCSGHAAAASVSVA